VKQTAFLVALTAVNVALFALQVGPAGEASAKEDLPVLRARGLEIVDDQGRLRAQLKVEPADPQYRWPDGSRVGYPETVIFRLVTPDGKPRVKLTTSETGSGLLLLGASDATQSMLLAEGATTSLRLRNDEKTQKVLAP
jgi:hypothetical protein